MKINAISMREVVFSTVMLASLTILFFAPNAYLTMLARAFLLQWALGFLVVALFALWRGRVLAMATAMLAALVSLVEVSGSEGSTRVAATGPGLRIAHMNVWQPNTDHQRTIDSVLATNADIISVQEVDPVWADALVNGLSEQYPFHRVLASSNCYGIALFSRYPFGSITTRYAFGTPFMDAKLLVGGTAVRVLCVHAPSPISYGHFKRRNAQLELLAEDIAGSAIPTVVIGDLNTVHWDYAFKRFCARSRSLPVTGPDQRTWPSIGPIALIPLDHILVSGGLLAEGSRTFTIPGSDHRGLLSSLTIPHHAP